MFTLKGRLYTIAICACLTTVHHIERQKRLLLSVKIATIAISYPSESWSSIAGAFQVLCKSVRPCVAEVGILFFDGFGPSLHGESLDEVSPFSLSAFCEVRNLHFLFTLSVNRSYRLSFQSRTGANRSCRHRVETIPSDIPQSGDSDLDWIIFHAGQRQAVDPRFIHAVIKQESNYKADALSPAGASGLMQLMPGTAKRFDCKDAKDQACNVEAGTKYLAWLLRRFNGDVTLALAGYNAGEGSVDKYQGVPPYPETQSYVTRIVSTYGKTYHPILESEDAKLAFNLIAIAPSAR